MVSRTPFRYINSSCKGLTQSGGVGLTIVELLLAITVLTLVSLFAILNINPWHFKQKGQDNHRLADLLLLERVITEYRVDRGEYPDIAGVERRSTVPSSLETTHLANANNGWINADLREYTTRLPLDPVNDATYYYSYIHDNDAFELNATLQVVTDKMTDDNGNDTGKYEVGNNLSLL